MTHNSVTRGGWAKSWYILHHHQGFFSRVCERARVLFERAIKSYFVDTLTENQICHPIPASLSENWALVVFSSVDFRMLLPLQYLRLYCMSNSHPRNDIIMFHIFFNNMVNKRKLYCLIWFFMPKYLSWNTHSPFVHIKNSFIVLHRLVYENIYWQDIMRDHLFLNRR